MRFTHCLCLQMYQVCAVLHKDHWYNILSVGQLLLSEQKTIVLSYLHLLLKQRWLNQTMDSDIQLFTNQNLVVHGNHVHSRHFNNLYIY